MKKKHNIKNIIIFFLLAITLSGYIVYLVTNIDQLTKENRDTITLEAASSESTERKELVNDITWCQQIKIEKKGTIKNIKFKLVDIPESVTGTLEIALTGTNGEVFYYKSIPCIDLVNGSYFRMSGFTEIELADIDVQVKKDQNLYFNCTADGLQQDAPAFALCKRNGMDILKIGEKTCRGKFLPLEYQLETKMRYGWIAGLTIIGMLIMSIALLYDKPIFRNCMGICCIFVPFIVLVCGAWLNSKMAYLKTEFGIINLFLIYVVYCIFYGIFGKK